MIEIFSLIEVSFSNIICIFARSFRGSYAFCDTKISEISDMAKS